MKINHHIISLFIVLILSLPTIFPLFDNGYFPMHDDTQPSRVYQMAEALRFGQFPVRWVGDLGYGYGYPLFNFYAPLPYYVGAMFTLAGIDVITSTKAMMLIGMMVAGLSMYYLVQRSHGEASAILAAILYMYAPYHALNLYVRGAVGELYAYGFLPLVLLGITGILESKTSHLKMRSLLIGSIGYAGVLLSHNITGLLLSLMLSIGVIIHTILLAMKKVKLQNELYLIFVILIGFGLSSFFTIPAFFEKQYTNVEKIIVGGSDFRSHFVYPDQYWNSPWGYAGSAAGREDGMSFKLGKIHILVLCTSLFILFVLKKHKLLRMKMILYIALIIMIISLLFTLHISQPIWEFIPIYPYIQFPWRLINYIMLGLSVIGSLIILPVTKKWNHK